MYDAIKKHCFFLAGVVVLGIAVSLLSPRLQRSEKQLYYATVRTFLSSATPTVLLDVPLHRQEHALSCEVAALKMALKYKGVSLSESEILTRLPFSDRNPRSGENTWGDPNLGFVGSIDGKMPTTGYGVYEKPIYNLALRWRGAKILENANLADLISALDNHNPIIVWGSLTASSRDISWTTLDGKYVKAIMGEHARLAIGYAGPRQNPSHIILADPVYGKLFWSVKKFMNNWCTLDRKAVVIY